LTEIDAFIERRAKAVHEDRPGQQAANELARMWAESDRRFEVRRRLQITAERYRYHDHLAGVFARMSEEHAAKAEALLEEDPRDRRRA
jgi:hypothetical protein